MSNRDIGSDGIQMIRTGSCEQVTKLTKVNRTGYWAAFMNIKKSTGIFIEIYYLIIKITPNVTNDI